MTTYLGLSGIDPRAVNLDKKDSRAGFFGYERRITRDDLLAGSSYTLICLETEQDNGPWPAGGPPTVRGLAPDEEHYLGPGRPFGGLHRGGANTLWADASVRFLSNSVPAADLRIQATLHGAVADGP
jgi:prepilin-type processing-associated H-X9-DG protein